MINVIIQCKATNLIDLAKIRNPDTEYIESNVIAHSNSTMVEDLKKKQRTYAKKNNKQREKVEKKSRTICEDDPT